MVRSVAAAVGVIAIVLVVSFVTAGPIVFTRVHLRHDPGPRGRGAGPRVRPHRADHVRHGIQSWSIHVRGRQDRGGRVPPGGASRQALT